MMNSTLPWRLCAAAVLAAVLSTIVNAASGNARPAPSVSLPDSSGTVITLQSLHGRVVLLDIWASWCPPCRTAFPAYDALYREYREQGFDVLAVNVDEKRSAAEEFLKGRDFQMKVLFDPKGTAPEVFRLRGMPTSYLMDKRGAIRFSHEGFTDKLVPQYRREIEQLLAEAP